MVARRPRVIRVAVVSTEFPAPSSAMEAHLVHISNGLAKGQDMLVTRLWPQRRRSGVARLFQVIWHQARFLWRLKHFDIAYVRWHPFAPLILWGCRLQGTSVILEVNGTTGDLVLAHPIFRKSAPIIDAITRYQFLSADLVLTVTSGLSAWVGELAGRSVRTAVILNGAPRDLLGQRQEPAAPPYAVFVGELAAWQGIRTLLTALELPEWPPGLRLVVVGDGRDQSLVEDHARRDTRLTYPGRLARPDAMLVLSRATLSISPQSAEVSRNRRGVSPLKVAESLMLGVPVVLSDLNASAVDVDENKLGASFASDDPRALAVAVANVSGDDDSGTRSRAAEWASSNLSWESAAERVRSLIYELKKQDPD